MKKVQVSDNKPSTEELAEKEMTVAISNLFVENYSLQTSSRKLLLKKFLSNEDFAIKLSEKAIFYLSEDDNKFDQYNVVLLLSKASDQSIQNGREIVRKYLTRIEVKNYAGPKMKNYISIIKKKL